MFFDPMYFLFILPGLGLSLWASARVKRAFNEESKTVVAASTFRQARIYQGCLRPS